MLSSTLTAVAKEAQVSVATASRAFSNPERLAPATRERVLSAAAKLDYRAEPGTRKLTIAVVVPDSANPVVAAIVTAIQEKLWPARHQMILANTAEDPEREAETLRSLSQGVDGVILVSPRGSEEATRRALGAVPAVAINADYGFCSTVLMDGASGIEQCIEYVHALGHRSLAYVPGPRSAWASARRLEAVRDSAKKWNLKLSVVSPQAASVEGGLAAAAAIVASSATAVIAFNDLIAMGVLAGARRLNRHCPEDLSVIGLDDLSMAAVAEPGLCSVRVHLTETANQAADLLLDTIGGRISTPRVVVQPSQFIVRGSTSRPRLQ